MSILKNLINGILDGPKYYDWEQRKIDQYKEEHKNSADWALEEDLKSCTDKYERIAIQQLLDRK